MAYFPLILPSNKLIKPRLGSKLIKEAPLADGLDGYWPLNEGTGNLVNDLSGNSEPGTWLGTTPWTSTPYGAALDFGDGIDLGNNPALTITGDITMLVCARRDGGGDRFLLSNSYTTDYAIETYGDGVVFWAAGVSSTASSIWTSSEWGTFVATFNKATTETILYFNGVSVRVTANAGTPAGTGNSWYLGRNNGTAYPWDGPISKAMIWNRVLSPSEIAREYSDPWWRFRGQSIELWSAATQGAVEEPPATAGFMTLNTGYW